MAFSRDLIPRLAYAKQMYLHGYEHGKGQGFLNKSLAIISIDGAIERFLWTIITEFNVSSNLGRSCQDSFANSGLSKASSVSRLSLRCNNPPLFRLADRRELRIF